MDEVAEIERDYLIMRRDAHAVRALQCVDPVARSLHERFAAAYDQRAASLVVDDD